MFSLSKSSARMGFRSFSPSRMARLPSRQFQVCCPNASGAVVTFTAAASLQSSGIPAKDSVKTALKQIGELHEVDATDSTKSDQGMTP